MISPAQLRRYPFFAGLTVDEVCNIAMIANEVSYPAGATIFRDGEEATRLFVLTSGTVDLEFHIQRPNKVDIAYVGSIAEGEPFALSAVLEPYRLNATCVADGPVQTIAIESAPLRALCDLNCHVGYAIMRQIARAQTERLSFARIQLAACG